MNYPVFSLLGITISLTVIAGSVLAIPVFEPAQKTRELKNTDTSFIWTSQPIRIDRNKQNFERLSATLVTRPETATGSIVSENMPKKARLTAQFVYYTDQNGANDVVADAGEEMMQNSDRDLITACGKRYSSYRVSDNTFQPYHGSRRPCETVVTASLHGSTNGDQLASNALEDLAVDEEHVQWCFARYRSYNPDDNTFRAFSGQIRTCASPYV